MIGEIAGLKEVVGREQPEWISPMLAILTDRRFSDPNWIYERKLDGERVLSFKKGGEVRLMSRNRKQIGSSYPEVVDALSSLDLDDFIADGEMVAFDGRLTSFQKLQGRMHLSGKRIESSKVEVFYYLFDLMFLDGHDLREVPLRRRKSLLKSVIDFDDPLRFTPHRNRDGEDYYRKACERGWEGVIAKRADSEYVSKRSKNWLKFKCVHQQEFVIGGFTEPKGSREGFGALLLGYYESDKLAFAGKVGTGFDDEMLVKLGDELRSIEIEDSPFDQGSPGDKEVHWVRPEKVGEVGFTEWTSSGKLRHPRFLGLRRDKPPEEVVRERPKG